MKINKKHVLFILAVAIPINILSAQVPTQEQCQQADAQLNQVYQQLRGSLNDAQKQQLKAAQRQWIKQRDAFVAQNSGNPQGALYQATIQRVRVLQGAVQQLNRQDESPKSADPGYIKNNNASKPVKTLLADNDLRIEFSDDSSGYCSISENGGLIATSTGNKITLWDLKTGYLLLKKEGSYVVERGYWRRCLSRMG
jgi:hypothetical protein